MSTSLARKRCEPCHAGTPRLAGAELEAYKAEVGERWKVEEDHHLTADFRFADFMAALRFTNRLGAIAEKEGHHPDVHLTWGAATVRIFTHAIDGLSENDFILAAKIDEVVAR